MSPKYFQTPFASNGDKAAIADLTQPDGIVSYQEGYGSDYAKNPIESGAKFIDRSQMNGLLNDLTDNLKQWQEQGYYTYNPAIKYAIGGRCNYNDGTGLKAYVSSADNNTSVPSINGVLQSGWQLSVSGRIKLSESINFYVSPAGDDGNDGLSAATPKKTFGSLNGLMENRYEYNWSKIYIHLAAGTYSGQTLWINPPLLLNAGHIYIEGEGTASTIISANTANGDGTYTVAAGIVVSGHNGPANVAINNIGFLNNERHIIARFGARVYAHNLQFGNTQAATGSTNGGSMFYVREHAFLSFYPINGKPGTINITGNSYAFIYVLYCSNISFENINIMFSGTRTISIFLYGSVSGHIDFRNTVNFSGSTASVVGKKFQLDWSSSINSNSQGVAALPGTVAGTANANRFAYYS